MKSLVKRVLLLAGVTLLLVACSTKQSIDDKFFSDLQSMWTARTQTLLEFQKQSESRDQSQQEAPKTNEVLKKTYTDEWNAMKDYQGQDLKDDQLNKNVKNYLDALKACKEALDGEFTIDKNKAFNQNYKKRVDALKALSADPRFTLPKDQLNDLNINDETIKKYEELEKKTKAASEQFQKDLKAMKLTLSKQPTTADPTVAWSGELTNHSEMEIRDLHMSFNMLDKDNKTLDAPKVEIDKLSPGQTYKFSISSKVLQYDHMQVSLDDQLKIVEPGSMDEADKQKKNDDSKDNNKKAEDSSQKKDSGDKK
ncbi:MAG: FxLYD domain-containing protein [Aerococcus sp.]|nr:FxLYD domain-containing protein [Aerococcus sp.]